MVLGPGDAQSDVGASPAPRCWALVLKARSKSQLEEQSLCPTEAVLEVKTALVDPLEIYRVRKWRQKSHPLCAEQHDGGRGGKKATL